LVENIIIAATVFLGSAVTGTAGFGFGIVSMSILPFVMSVKIANPMVSIYAIVIFGIMNLQFRKSISWSKSLPLVIGSVVGIPVGVLGLIYLDETLMRRLIGGFITLYVAYSLTLGRRALKGINPKWGYLAGFLGGCTGGAFNTSGPPVAIYLSAQPWDKGDIKNTLQFYFLFNYVYKVTILFFSGLLTKEILLYNLYFSPFLLVGMFVGWMVFTRLRNDIFRWLILVLLAVSAVLLIVKNE